MLFSSANMKEGVGSDPIPGGNLSFQGRPIVLK